MTTPGRRRRAAAQPTAPAAVLLASTTGSFSPEAIRIATQAADGRPVAVLVITRIHGYALGIPNPGLLPTRREQETARNAVSDTVLALSRGGVSADGQVAATRSAAKTIARVARARGARHVVMDTPTGSRLRRFVEGEPSVGLRRRVDPSVSVHIVTRSQSE